ncbi:MAG: hypothetical protein ACI8QC_000133 [Planctomycetota bacterium]|jgi:hypothetical protein
MRATILALLCLLPACSSAGGKSRNTGEVRSVAELPESYSKLWLAFRGETVEWPALRDAALLDPGQESFLVQNLVRTLLQGLQARQADKLNQSGARLCQRASEELLSMGSAAAEAVAELLAVSRGEVTELASKLLLRMGPEALDALLVILVREEPVNARRQAATLLADMPYGLEGREQLVREALAERLEQDPDWLVRKRAARALALRGLRDTSVEEARRALCAALSDTDFDVRHEAILGLLRLDDPGCVPALINLLERSSRAADPGGMAQAQKALQEITNTSERRKPMEWRTFWRDQRKALMGSTGAKTGSDR